MSFRISEAAEVLGLSCIHPATTGASCVTCLSLFTPPRDRFSCKDFSCNHEISFTTSLLEDRTPGKSEAGQDGTCALGLLQGATAEPRGAPERTPPASS